jgi:hypothetical protein
VSLLAIAWTIVAFLVGAMVVVLCVVLGILATAEGVTSSVGHMVNVVSETISSPLVRLSALAYGLRRAAGRAGEGEPSARRGRFRRRR